ncbi:hypothetical protein [Trebonia sp.]|nr:hypothetical protein [Trebonia sp.]
MSGRPPRQTWSTTATMARVELAAYGGAVTDWELRRHFERI